jgi:hypothetical protein
MTALALAAAVSAAGCRANNPVPGSAKQATAHSSGSRPAATVPGGAPSKPEASPGPRPQSTGAPETRPTSRSQGGVDETVIVSATGPRPPRESARVAPQPPLERVVPDAPVAAAATPPRTPVAPSAPLPAPLPTSASPELAAAAPPRVDPVPAPAPPQEEHFPEFSASSATAEAAAAPPLYTGPSAGTFTCNGTPIVQNGEVVFEGLPPGRIQVIHDTSIWEARVRPDDNNTQKLILRNRRPGTQRRCTVTWRLLE